MLKNKKTLNSVINELYSNQNTLSLLNNNESCLSLPDLFDQLNFKDTNPANLKENLIINNLIFSNLNIICNFCKRKSFTGDRYKCFECIDFDLCSICFEGRKISDSHKLFHPMIKIDSPLAIDVNSKLNYCLEINALQKIDTIHTNVNCDGCLKQNFKGLRFKCEICSDCDFCFDCYKKGHCKKNNHFCVIFILSQELKIYKKNDIQKIKFLGNGKFGNVDKCLLKPLNENVAVKYMKINEKESFIKELKVLEEIKGENVTKFYGLIETNNGPNAIILKLCTLGSLESFLKKNKVSLRRKLGLIIDILKGLRRFHQKGYIHKDIKWDNIFVDKGQIGILGDCGISKYSDEIYQNDYMVAGQSICCIAFMPPESISNKIIGKCYDIYCIGIIINWIFTQVKHKFIDIILHTKINFGKNSPYFFDVIKQCTDNDFKKRPTVDQLLNFFQNFNDKFFKQLGNQIKKYITLNSVHKDKIFKKIYNLYFEKNSKKIL